MPTLSSKTPYYGGKQSKSPLTIYLDSGAPSSNDKDVNLGDEYLDKTAGEWYKVSGFANGTEWERLQTGSGSHPITPYVVGPSGGFSTIQSAIDAAAADGGGAVYIQPGTYTENLTLVSGVSLNGVDQTESVINGVLTPPTSGNILIHDLTLTSATSIFSSAVAGNASITVDNCFINATDGYLFDLLNWTGVLEINGCGTSSTKDGIVNNTGGCRVFLADSSLGAGTLNSCILSGIVDIQNTDINCPVDFRTGSSFTLDISQFNATVTLSNNSTGLFADCRISSLTDEAIIMSSSGEVIISNCIIDSSNSPAIDGSGSGTLFIGTVTFETNSELAATLTTQFNPVRTGDVLVSGQLQVQSGTVTDFAGSFALTAGTQTIANTNIAATDKIFLQRQAINGSTAIGNLIYSITPATSFTITSVSDASPGSTETNDVSLGEYIIVRGF